MPQSVALLCRGGKGEEIAHSRADGAMRLSSSGLGLDVFAAEHVIAALESTTFRLVCCMSWRRFRWRAVSMNAAVLLALRLDVDGVHGRVHGLVQDDFPCPLILVTSGDRENLRHLGRVTVTEVVFLDEVNRRLASVLSSVALSDGRRLLRAAILRSGMHPTLRRALRALVGLPLPRPTQKPGPNQRFPRTVGDLAAVAGVSADYLRHLATGAHLPIGHILRRYAALQALEMLAEGAPAHVVTACFGYEDMSGVDKLILRNLGGRLGSLVQTSLQPHYAETARLVQGPEIGRVSRPPGRRPATPDESIRVEPLKAR